MTACFFLLFVIGKTSVSNIMWGSKLWINDSIVEIEKFRARYVYLNSFVVIFLYKLTPTKSFIYFCRLVGKEGYDVSAEISTFSGPSYSLKDDFFKCDKKTVDELSEVGEVGELIIKHRLLVLSYLSMCVYV